MFRKMESKKTNSRMPTDRDVKDWLSRMPDLEIDLVLVILGLRDPGERLERLDRIYNWLHGQYNAANFKELPRVKDEAEAREMREHMKWAYLKETCFDESALTRLEENYEKGMPHPLTIFLDGETSNGVGLQEQTHDSTLEVSLQEQTHDSNLEVSLQKLTHDLTLKVSLQEQTHDSTNGGDEKDNDPTDGQHSCCATREELSQIWSALQKFAELTEARFSAMSTEMARLSATVANLTSLQGQQQRQESPVSNARFDETSRKQVRGNGTDSGHRDETGNLVSSQGNSQTAVPCNYSFGGLRGVLTKSAEDPPVQVGVAWGVGESDAEVCSDTASHSSGSSRDERKFTGSPSEKIEVFLQDVEEDRKAKGLRESESLASLSQAFSGAAGTWYCRHYRSWRNWAEFRQAAIHRWESKTDLRSQPAMNENNCKPGNRAGKIVSAEGESKKKTLPPDKSAKLGATCRPQEGKAEESVVPDKKGKVEKTTLPEKAGQAKKAASPKKLLRQLQFKLKQQWKIMVAVCREYDPKRSNSSESGGGENVSPVRFPKKTAGRKSRSRKKKRSGTFQCFGCGAPNVIRRDCSVCSESEHGGA